MSKRIDILTPPFCNSPETSRGVVAMKEKRKKKRKVNIAQTLKSCVSRLWMRKFSFHSLRLSFSILQSRVKQISSDETSVYLHLFLFYEFLTWGVRCQASVRSALTHILWFQFPLRTRTHWTCSVWQKENKVKKNERKTSFLGLIADEFNNMRNKGEATFAQHTCNIH